LSFIDGARAEAAIPSNLLAISTARETPHPNRGPPKFNHQLRKASARTRPTGSLRNFQDVEHGLSCYALDPIVADFTVQPF
jgi:hypothetical protein